MRTVTGAVALRFGAAATALVAAVLGIALSSAAVAAPPDPVRQSTAAAQAVSGLQHQVTVQTQRLNEATATLNTAQSNYNAAITRKHRAQRMLSAAQADERAAQRQYERAQQDLVAVAVSNYQNTAAYGSLDVASMSSLLLSSDPTSLLGTAATQEQVDAYQVNVLDSVRQALAARSRAVQQRRAAL
jgi:hypothetical protein